MSSFLSQILSSLDDKKGAEIRFVFPTQRAASLFKHEFFTNYNKSIELPVITTWSDIVDSLNDRQIIDKKIALGFLYEAFLNTNKSAENFDSFVNWGEVVFDDFERIVLQDLDAEKVLSQVNIIKTLEKWNLDLNTKKNYLKIWDILPSLFTEFYGLLKRKNLGTNATKYKSAISGFKETKIHQVEFCFCGFTIFSPVEKKLLNAIKEFNQINFIHDSPIWGEVSSKHESNKFESINESLFSTFKAIESESEIEKEMEGLSCANDLVAVKALSEILIKVPESDLRNWAIVLLSDSDLPLLLNSIPNHIQKLNIGKGNPYLNTYEGLLFKTLISLHQSLEKKKELSFLEIFDLLDNLKPLNVLSFEQIEKLRDSILRGNLKALNRVQFSEILLKTPLKTLSALFFKKTKLSDFVKQCLLLEFVTWELTNEIVNNVNSKLNYFKDKKFEIELYSSILENEIQSASVPIQGSKENGLQIMSLLETRCLDFENLIFLSFTDENLPQSTLTTYIPLEIRTQYQFPDQSAREAVFAFHFMRLLKRSKNVKFIFSESSSISKSGDPSRFLLQAKMEWQKNDSKLDFKSTIVKNRLEPFVKNELSIEKSDNVYEQIKNYLFNRGLSPSALNVYLSNPMDFLLYHVLGLREKENVDLAIETSTLGTVIHNTLEELYTPYLSKHSGSINMKEIIKPTKSLLIKELSKVYPESYLQSGRLKILVPVLEKWVQNFLWIDKKRGEVDPFTLIKLEQKLECKVSNSELPFKLKGVVDRLENWKGAEHVIDYKTGKVDQRDLVLTTEELFDFNPDKSKAYQLLMYTFIYRESNTGSNSLLSSIYSFRNQKSGYLPLMVDKNENIGKKEMDAFESGLTKIVKSMLNQEVPIELTNHRYQKFSV